MNKQIRFHIGYWVAAMIGLLVVQYVYATAQRVAPIPYSQFQQLLHDGKVAEIARSMVTRYGMSKHWAASPMTATRARS
jgi:cell division protease FtsH